MSLGTTEIAVLAASLCALATMALIVVLGIFFAVRSMRRRQQRAVEAHHGALPEEIRAVMDGGVDFRAISDLDARREALLKYIGPGLGYLRDHEIEHLDDGGTRFTGSIGKGCVLEITADGTVPKLHATGEFAFGDAVLRASGEHTDPKSNLGRLDADTANELVEQMREVGVTEVRFQTDGVTVVVDGSVYDNELGSMRLSVGSILSTLENSVSAWEWLEPDPEPEPEEAPLPSDPVSAAFVSIGRDDGRRSGDKLLEACTLLFDGVGKSLENPKSKLDKDMIDQELRGRVGDIPVRMTVERDGTWEVQTIAEVGGWAGFRYDLTLEPIESDPDDDFAENDTIRVFVAKGMYIEGTHGDLESAMGWLSGATDSQLEQIRMALSHLPLRGVTFNGDKLHVFGNVSLTQLADPVGVCRSVVELAGRLSTEHSGGQVRELRQQRCAYCHARYFFGPQREACPNCGAPPGA